VELRRHPVALGGEDKETFFLRTSAHEKRKIPIIDYQCMKNSTLITVSALMLIAICHSAAEIMPVERRIDWSQSGIPGGVPVRTKIYTTINAALYGNGVTDATSAIQAALTACPANQVIYVPAGVYKIQGSLKIPSNVTLRGAGPQKTILEAHGSGNGFIIFDPDLELWNPPLIAITAGMAKNSTVITVTDTTGISVGCYLKISQLNDSAYVTITGVGGKCTWCDEGYNGIRSMGQMVEVVSKSGNNIGIVPGLYFTYSASLSPAVSVQKPGVSHAGVEDLQVYMNNTGYTANIQMNGAAYCWIKNIESNYADGDHVRLFSSYRCEIRDSYFHDAFSHLPGQTDADIIIASKSSGNLVENNILRRLHASVMLNWGASGNSISYNFCEGNFDSRVSYCLFADLSVHGAHPMFNLWEGNVVGMLNPDSYWGSSSHNTGFRNWMKGATAICNPIVGRGPEQHDSCWWAIQNNRAVALDFACRYYSLIGNVAGSVEMLNLTYYNNGTKKIPAFPQCVAPKLRSYDNAAYGFSFGYASSGDDGTSAFANPLPYTTAFLHGNVNLVDNAVTWNSGTVDHVLPPSLYLTAKPEWFGSVPWPPLGPDVAGYTNKIPAQLRYEGMLSGLSRTGEERPVGFFEIYAIGSGYIRYTIPRPGDVKLEIHTLAGRNIATLVNRPMDAGEHTARLGKTALSKGIYVCCLRVGNLKMAKMVTLVY
jgi:hypothetical protein